MRVLQVVLSVAIFALPSSLALAGSGVITPGPHVTLAPALAPSANTGVFYRTLGYSEFLPLDSSVGYARSSTVNDGRYATSAGSDTFGTLETTLNLPSGAILQSLELDFCANNSGTGGIGLVLAVEDKSGIVSLQLPMMGVTGPVGCMNVVANLPDSSFVVDNNATRMMPQVITFGGAFDGSVTFSGVVVGYTLQVSPAPGTPTFNDVPTSDFGFQYIEALAASGITGGCGGGNYCPDNPVTRRQMAIFLAKALGLSFN